MTKHEIYVQESEGHEVVFVYKGNPIARASLSFEENREVVLEAGPLTAEPSSVIEDHSRVDLGESWLLNV